MSIGLFEKYSNKNFTFKILLTSSLNSSNLSSLASNKKRIPESIRFLIVIYIGRSGCAIYELANFTIISIIKV